MALHDKQINGRDNGEIMGCDIHYVLERKVNGKWLGLLSKHPLNKEAKAGDRNYAAFAQLASVRGTSSKSRYPKFIPSDPSELALYCMASDGSDGHSHSYLPLSEFCLAYLEADEMSIKEGFGRIIPEGKKEEPWESLFGIYIEQDSDGTPEDYRVVFWFDN